MRNVQTAKAGLGRQEWSDWDERHGRQSREVTVERSGSCRDTKRLPIYDAPAARNNRFANGSGLSQTDPLQLSTLNYQLSFAATSH
jgi:hypothetical protein